MASETQLAQLLCARLCHDLSGSLGTLAGALDLVTLPSGADQEALSLARDAAEVLRARLLVMRALAGSGPTDAATLVDTVAPALAERRVRLETTLAPAIDLVPDLAAAWTAALLLGGEALPRGGLLRVEAREDVLRLVPEGRSPAWPPSVHQALAGAAPDAEGGARHVLAFWLLALLRDVGWRAALAAEGVSGETRALLLQPGA